MSIRKAVVNDAPRIHELLVQIANWHHELYPEYFDDGRAKYTVGEIESLIDELHIVMFVYEHESTIEGYCIGWYEDDIFFVDDLCVNEALRGQRIGHQLMEHLEQTVHAKEIRLNVWLRNTAAVRFYEREGYTPLKQVLVKKVGNTH
ncbi:GNAT family N-acetyltransferase [Erysipelothrix sp. HDW6C]|uniref:GNAT family N-acetyltransferase n=1 Tax=Erysipelothrix sp. HDW6C TaxID=2714930 RepID=UPI00140A6698|nr:GNAT family N-acetyltransferase [Erysipelothrix sp. HDW6C]QIK69653.1 GNAT family N-acetyltransferase [Erysipelothrix sp. HDW6C]